MEFIGNPFTVVVHNIVRIVHQSFDSIKKPKASRQSSIPLRGTESTTGSAAGKFPPSSKWRRSILDWN